MYYLPPKNDGKYSQGIVENNNNNNNNLIIIIIVIIKIYILLHFVLGNSLKARSVLEINVPQLCIGG
jgi:hypothetical protein